MSFFITFWILILTKKSLTISEDFKISSISSRNFTTVITCYFQFKSKHSIDDYNKWMANILQSVSSPLVVFTDIKSKEYILKMRPETKFHTFFYIYEDVWEVMRELEVERNRTYNKKYKQEQFYIDPENNIHNPNLYAVWNIKAFITYEVLKQNPFNSKFFIYTDIGAFRDEIIPDWPDNSFVELLSCKLHNRILFGQIQDFVYNSSDSSDSFITKDLIEGTFFAGSKTAIENFKINFYKLHDELLDKQIFVGKDQKIMNLYAFKRNKNENVRLRTWNVKCSKSYDNWFFYQKFLADIKYFNCYENKFSFLINS